MYDNSSKNGNNSINDDDYQYYERKPLGKILLIIAGVLAIGALVYFVFIRNPHFKDSGEPLADTSFVKQPSPAPPVAEPVEEPEVNISNTAAGNRYHIIAGAFVVEKNANSFMQELQKKGYSPKIILKRNEYSFISIFSFPTFKEANAKYKELENQGFPIWIMKYKT